MLFNGEKLRNLREQRKWRMADTAKQLGVSAQYLYSIEKGRKKNLREETVEKIATLFGVHPSYFYGESHLELADVNPDMPGELRDFVVVKDNLPYLAVALKAKKADIPPALLSQQIDMYFMHSRHADNSDPKSTPETEIDIDKLMALPSEQPDANETLYSNMRPNVNEAALTAILQAFSPDNSEQLLSEREALLQKREEAVKQKEELFRTLVGKFAKVKEAEKTMKAALNMAKSAEDPMDVALRELTEKEKVTS